LEITLNSFTEYFIEHFFVIVSLVLLTELKVCSAMSNDIPNSLLEPARLNTVAF